MSESADVVDVVVLGAGLAGAATAFFLSRERGLSLVLLERERIPGRHSSGRSAGLVRRAAGDREVDALCEEGATFIGTPPADFAGDPKFRRTGSWLLVTADQAREWSRPGIRIASHGELARAVPPFVPDEATSVLHCEADGVVDPAALLAGFCEGASARGTVLRTAQDAIRIEVDERHGSRRVLGVTTRAGRISCRAVVDAAGAWAGEVARSAAGDERGLAPFRRHLLVTEPDPRVDPRWPWVWDTVRGFYFRPEAGGLLACACDDEPDRPRDCEPDRTMESVILSALARHLPAFAGAKPKRLWAGHRTRRSNGRFLLGADPHVRGLYLAAGLGGHGVTSAAAVGRRVSDAVLADLRAGT